MTILGLEDNVTVLKATVVSLEAKLANPPQILPAPGRPAPAQTSAGAARSAPAKTHAPPQPTGPKSGEKKTPAPAKSPYSLAKRHIVPQMP